MIMAVNKKAEDTIQSSAFLLLRVLERHLPKPQSNTGIYGL